MGAAETISKSLGMARPPSMACLGVVEPRPMPVGMVSVIPMKLEVVWSPHLASSFFFSFFFLAFWGSQNHSLPKLILAEGATRATLNYYYYYYFIFSIFLVIFF